MSLVRWSPMRELNWLDRFGFGDLSAPLEQNTRTVFTPTIEVVENDDGYIIRAELPGVGKKELKVGIDGDLLTIQGERKEAKEEKEEKDAWYVIRERSYGAFQRSLRLPDTVNLEAATATHEDGVLTIELPKKEEAKVVKRDIEVN